MNKQQVFESLNKAHVSWDRTDANHIIIWTPGYKSAACTGLEQWLILSGFKCVDQEYDSFCGKTRTVFLQPKD